MHEQQAAERGGAQVVDAARAVRHVAHDHAFDCREALEDVSDRARVQQQALGHLQRHKRRL